MNPSDFSSKVSALDAHSDKLSHALTVLGTWLDFATCVVAVGLVLEAIEIAEFVGAQIRRHRRGKKLEWCKGFMHCGAIMVLAGVTGEFVVQFKAAKLELQRYEDERHVATLRTEEATDAEGKIATLQKSTADALRVAANATRDAANLGVDQKNLHGFVDAQRTAIAADLQALKQSESDLDAAVTRANKRLEPRDLSGAKLERFVTSLSNFPRETVDIWVSASGDVQESLNLGRLLFNALAQAGLRPAIISGISAMFPGTAVALRKLPSNSAPTAEAQTEASALLKALSVAQLVDTHTKVDRDVEGPYGTLFPIRIREGEPPPYGTPSPVILFVGPKPE